MRYIDADRLIDDIRPFAEYDSNLSNKDWIRRFEIAIDNVPTADVRENVRGEWIRRDSRYVGWISFDCSVCGETLELDMETSNDFKYCPFCGAEMRKGGAE